MRKLVGVALLALLWVSQPALAQGFLPAQFGGWSGSPLTTYEPNALETIGPDDAAAIREYGVIRAERRRYTRGDGELRVTLYHMRDPTSAYGAFSYLRAGSPVASQVGQLSSLTDSKALFVVGNFLVEAGSPDMPALVGDLKAVAEYLAPRADQGPFPDLAQYLPRRGLVAGTQRYVLGPLVLAKLLPLGKQDWLGFSGGAEAELARYRVGGDELTLLLVSFPTPQSAAGHVREWSQWFDVNPDQAAPGPASLFVRRASSVVAVVADADSRRTAEHLLRQIQYETQITWNEPGFAADEPPVGVLLYNTFLAAGVLIVFTIIASLAFGGIRLALKAAFPGKIFDRPDRLEVIQLGLSGKPIQSKDFY